MLSHRLQAGKKDRQNYLSEFAYEVYLKDIVGRKDVRDIDTLKEFFYVLASSIGCPTSPSKLEKLLKAIRKTQPSDDSINVYIDHFQDAFVVSKARRYNIKGNAYINTPYKVYFEDAGVRNAVTSFGQIEETHLLENIIYNELRYRNFHVSVGEIDANEASDRLDKNGKRIYVKKELEVDFVAIRGNQKYYVQSCSNISDSETLKRGKRSLHHIDNSFKKIIVAKDSLPIRKDESGFVIIDLYDFLLNYDSLNF